MGKWSGFPLFVVPRIVPPVEVIPWTFSRVRGISPPSGYRSGMRRPLYPSRTPTHCQSRFRADRTAARMTAFNPGASPPPVEIAIRLIFEELLIVPSASKV